jgi:hypothetical protein
MAREARCHDLTGRVVAPGPHLYPRVPSQKLSYITAIPSETRVRFVSIVHCAA